MNYKSFAYSAAGANHLRDGKICQDYSLEYSNDDVLNPFSIIAAADGHGGEQYFLSDCGARFACESAVKVLKKFLEKHSLFPLMLRSETIPIAALKTLAEDIVAEWNTLVAADWATEPDSLLLDEKDSGRFPQYYGTTLIAAVVTGQCAFGLQIGDGKCVVIDQEGNAAQPIPWDDDCYLNVTTSICESDAIEHFRFFYQRELPAAIFIGTDGVDNSYPVFENEKHLAKLYKTIWLNFGGKPFDEAKKELAAFLPVLSQKGSGDDVSMAGILDYELLELFRCIKRDEDKS